MACIVLETERIILRPFVADDAPAMARVLSGPIAMQWYPHPLSMQEVRDWIERNKHRHDTDGYGLWAMVLKHPGELAGDCGLVKQDVDGEMLVEVGYHVRRDLWGRGLATEAARACIAYAFRTMHTERVISLIRPENRASCRVAEKNGLRVWKSTVRAGYAHDVYSITREEHAAR